MKRRVFLGIDIGGTNIKLAIINSRGQVSGRTMIDTRASEGPEAAFKRIRDALPPMLRRDQQIHGAGVGCAGLVDSRRGHLFVSPNLPEWRNAALSRIAKRFLGVYTCVDNDANAAAYGEYVKGAGRRARTFLCITLGTGVGGGIVNEGRVLRGARNYAGEIGHMTINEAGPLCGCGNRGCLEAYVGAGALVRSARSKLRRRKRGLLAANPGGKRRALTPKHIAEAARKGDAVAKEVFDDAARHLGTAIASVVNLLNPDVIALTGGVAGGFDLMKKRLRETVTERAFTESARAVTITSGQLGFDAATVGAALMVRDSVRNGVDATP